LTPLVRSAKNSALSGFAEPDTSSWRASSDTLLGAVGQLSNVLNDHYDNKIRESELEHPMQRSAYDDYHRGKVL